MLKGFEMDKELTGADLDLAVATAGREWETAHSYFPTMTLDPTFSGARVFELHNGRFCYLEPRNPMRQDPQEYSPSTDWRFGGPIIERERINLCFSVADANLPCPWHANIAAGRDGVVGARGPTPLIAAMRCYVASKAAASS